MRSILTAVLAASLTVGSVGLGPVLAQGVASDTAQTQPTRSRGRRATGPKRERTAGQIAASERMRKCGVEWRDAKAKGTTGGLKWPKYWSQCNARLKGNAA